MLFYARVNNNIVFPNGRRGCAIILLNNNYCYVLQRYCILCAYCSRASRATTTTAGAKSPGWARHRKGAPLRRPLLGYVITMTIIIITIIVIIIIIIMTIIGQVFTILYTYYRYGARRSRVSNAYRRRVWAARFRR